MAASSIRAACCKTFTASCRIAPVATWTARTYLAASLPPVYVPYATSGGVLPDGRVLLIGGEYTMTKAVTNGEYNLVFVLTNKMAVYDPVKDTWTMVAPPAGWDSSATRRGRSLRTGICCLGRS